MSDKVRFVNYPLQYQNLKKEIDAAMEDVLNRGDLINRSDVEEFESGVASFVGVKHAVSLNSGTDALIFALMAAGIGPGDEVITVSHTFIASISCIVHCGATPILIEVGEDFNMAAGKLEQAITPKTKAIIPVYLNGRMCDMEKIMAIAEKHNLIVVEDSAQALGAKFEGRSSGSIGLAGCFSFYPAKILGCFGDGGMLTTNNSAIAEKVALLRDHGQKTKTEILCYGFTSRLDNLQAAVLSIRLRCLPESIRRRREIAEIYNNKLADIPEIELPPAPNDQYFDVYQNYVLKAQKRNEFFAYLKENGVETLIKDPIPNHWHKGLDLSHFTLPYTEQLAKEVISLPMYPELTNEQVDYVIDRVHGFYSK